MTYYWVGLDCGCTPVTTEAIGVGVMVECPEHGPVYVNDGGHALLVEMACGCSVNVHLAAIANPTDEQVLEAITNPGIHPGVTGMCDEHGPQIVERVD